MIFGKLKGKNCDIEIFINDQPTDVHMKLGKAGEGYFEIRPNISDSEESDGMSEEDFQIDKAKLDQF